MINLTQPEIAEIRVESLPPASLEALKAMRNEACETTPSSSFKLQPQQKFLRRILSPDAPTRSLLMVHGLGTGKTCTAIQVAEEYILRPEFQDKTVMVVASAAVQDNFRTQLFDMSRVNIDTVAGTLDSKQCTGRRYLDMLLRIESEPKNWNNPDVRDKLERTADRIIDEFYDFIAYESFGNLINEKMGGTAKDMDIGWIHETFDNRLLIIDEAHNLKESKNKDSVKGVTRAMENLVKIADGLVLVLLTATPMFDTYDEIAYYMNLFLWNDRKQDPKKTLKTTDFFNADATLKTGPSEEEFRKWVQTYVSYVKGENPFTFPFRLPPPKAISATDTRKSFLGKAIAPVERFKYLDKYLVASTTQGVQKTTLVASEAVDSDESRPAALIPTLAVLPGNKSFSESFRLVGKQYAYTGQPFLTPETLPQHAAKFASVLRSIEAGKGLVFVYSNYVQMGSRLFSMALEEHGYQPAQGQPLLASSSYTGPVKGKYVLLSDTSESEFNRLMDLAKSSKNREGEQVKVVVASVIASEGVDFRYVRQIHVLDPWWNMSRIEQVLGRGLRTCSHQLLDFEDQNCSVYLHIARTEDGRECFDEYTYRTKVETKAIKIAKVRKVLAESAMDCPLQNQVNSLPEDWKTLDVPQRASESRDLGNYKLYGMMAPTFNDSPEISACVVQPSEPDPEHKRPLSTYLDVRDEILNRLAQLFIHKPIWDRNDLFHVFRLSPAAGRVVGLSLQGFVWPSVGDGIPRRPLRLGSSGGAQRNDGRAHHPTGRTGTGPSSGSHRPHRRACRRGSRRRAGDQTDRAHLACGRRHSVLDRHSRQLHRRPCAHRDRAEGLLPQSSRQGSLCGPCLGSRNGHLRPGQGHVRPSRASCGRGLDPLPGLERGLGGQVHCQQRHPVWLCEERQVHREQDVCGRRQTRPQAGEGQQEVRTGGLRNRRERQGHHDCLLQVHRQGRRGSPQDCGCQGSREGHVGSGPVRLHRTPLQGRAQLHLDHPRGTGGLVRWKGQEG
jgi:hypothetical protein